MLEVDYDVIESLASDMKLVVDTHIWYRGYDYFAGGAIRTVMSEGHLVFARVRGSARNLYTVQLDLDQFRRSHCSCPHDRFCKHLVAVFFSLYDSVGDPGEFLRSVEDENLVSSAPREQGSIQSLKRGPKGQGTPSLGTEPVPAPTQDSSFEDWVRYADAEYRKIASRITTEGYRLDAETDFIQPLSLVHEPWPQHWQRLHQLFVLVFLVVKGDELAGSSGKIAHGYYAGALSQRILQTAINRLDEVSQAIMDESSDTLVLSPQFTGMLTYVRNALFASPVTEGPLLVYLSLWVYLSHQSRDYGVEIDTLQQAISPLPAGVPSRSYGEQALCLLYMLAHDDEGARRLALANATSISTYKICLAGLERLGETQRYIEWLRWFTAHDDVFDAREHAAFTAFWLTAVRLDPTAGQECEDYLKRYLPRTAHAYDTYLLVSEQYPAWVEERMLRGSLPIHADKAALALVEKASRESLLPWYHQAVERSIREKNRGSYKVAVRLMKKLQGHYKKLKQPERFESYLVDLKSRYSRFRALHEEMQKKGLIPS